MPSIILFSSSTVVFSFASKKMVILRRRIIRKISHMTTTMVGYDDLKKNLRPMASASLNRRSARGSSPPTPTSAWSTTSPAKRWRMGSFLQIRKRLPKKSFSCFWKTSFLIERRPIVKKLLLQPFKLDRLLVTSQRVFCFKTVRLIEQNAVFGSFLVGAAADPELL